MDAPSGMTGGGKSSDMLLATQHVVFRVERKGTHADSGTERLCLGGIIGGKTHDGIGLGVADPHTIPGVDDDVEGRFQPGGLYDLPVPDPTAGKIQQLIVRSIGNPDVAVRCNADAHQSEEFFLEREIALAGNGLAVEIHDQNLAVEAGDPDAILGHGGAPAHAVDAHACEAGNRRGKRRPIGAVLAHASTRVYARL